MASCEPTHWLVAPGDIAQTRFGDPESFNLVIRKGRRDGIDYFIVGTNNMTGYTVNGRMVHLRHDVNAKHARHPTFEAAFELAQSLVDGVLIVPEYRYWRTEDERRFGPFPTPTTDRLTDSERTTAR